MTLDGLGFSLPSTAANPRRRWRSAVSPGRADRDRTATAPPITGRTRPHDPAICGRGKPLTDRRFIA